MNAEIKQKYIKKSRKYLRNCPDHHKRYKKKTAKSPRYLEAIQRSIS
jgi:hypothetical protein